MTRDAVARARPARSRVVRGAAWLVVAAPVGIFAALALIGVWAFTDWSAQTDGWPWLLLVVAVAYSLPVLAMTGAGAVTLRSAGRGGQRAGAALVITAAALTTCATTWVLLSAAGDAPRSDDALLIAVWAVTTTPWLAFGLGAVRD